MTTETETYQEWAERVTRFRDCEICGSDAGEVHHIARGANKDRTRRELCAVLFVCRACHKQVHEGMSVAEQLAYLWLRRPLDFNAEAFWKLTGRVWPSLEDITAAHASLWVGINKRTSPRSGT